ncbi:MAG: peptide chain release factor N(5)-glutamine methyltransferase [Terracidiphilus sp.]
MTLEEWVRRGEARLRQGPHPERARRDAETLLLYVIRRERAALLARWKERLDEVEAEDYARLVERRMAGEPLQYILGETEFYGLPFRVNPDVLIPRPETEHLVEKALELASHIDAGCEGPRIADIGTGSGAIAVTLAHGLDAARVTAVDLSAAALLVARQNAERNGVADRIRFLRGDLLEPVAGERFEMVVSNPPYVSRAEQPSLPVEVREYEPPMAIFAGADGLEIYRRLIPAAFEALEPGGFLLLEIGCGQEPAVTALLVYSAYHRIEFVPDLQGIPRVAVAQRP